MGDCQVDAILKESEQHLKLWFVHLEAVSVASCVFDKRRKYRNTFFTHSPRVQGPRFSGIQLKQRVPAQPEGCHWVLVLEAVHVTHGERLVSRSSLFARVLRRIRTGRALLFS